jgi:ubiquinone biosynthesis protein
MIGPEVRSRSSMASAIVRAMSILSTVRDLDRLRVITQVLIRHGFGHLAVKMGLPGAKKAKPPAPQPTDEPSPAEGEGANATVAAADGQAVPMPAGPQLGERLRLVLQDLGTTFVKLGQIVSTRPDLVPEDIVVELKKLQDDVKPFPTEEAREVIERELGAPIEELFVNFGKEPLACASVAQVYRAELKLPSGEGTVPVVLKVQRPGIEATVERDINLLHWLARLLEATVPEARVYSPKGLVDEFEQAIKAELDFIVEAQNAERFAENFAGDETIRFPRAYREASSKRVLTLEFFDGVKVTDAVRAGADGPWIAETSVRLILKMVFEDGFFHADPHPGNILILPRPTIAEGAPAGGEARYAEDQQLVIGLLDLGLVGRLSPELRDKTTDLLLAAARNDADALADALIAIGKPRRRVDREAFREYTRRVSEAHLGKEMKDMEAAAIFRDIIAGALKFGIEIPSELTMLFRAIMTIEGVGKEIDPELDVLAVARPYLVKMLWQRYHPTRLAKDFWRDAGRLSVVARELPAQLSRIIEDLQRGDFRVKTEDRDRARALERLGRRLRATAVTITTMASGVALLIADRYTDLGQGLLIFGMAWMVLHFAVDYRHQKRDGEQQE